MEKQPSSSTLANYAQKMVQPSISLFGILKESFKTSARNGKNLLFITLIMLSCYTAMEFTNAFIFIPIMNDTAQYATILANAPFTDADPVAKEAFLRDFRHAVTYLFSYLCFLCLVLAFSATASVHSSLEAHTRKVLSLKDLFLGIRRSWKRALQTSVWIGIISLAVAALFFLGDGFTAEGDGFTALNWGMAIFEVFYGTCLCSMFMVGLVVSVIEKGFSGLRAIGEANEVRKGKKWQGFVLMAIMLLLKCAALGFPVRLLPKNLDTRVSVAMGIAMTVPRNLVYCVWKLFVFAVFTVYYHECKQRKMEEETQALYTNLAVDQF